MKNFTSVVFVFSVAIILATTTLLAQQKQRDEDPQLYRIGITNGSFVPKITLEKDFQQFTRESFDNKYFLLIQFYEIPSDEQRKLWASDGLILTDYLPGNAYYAVVQSDFNIGDIRDDIRSILEVDSRFKMETMLYFNSIPEYTITGDNMAKMTLSYYQTINPEQVMIDLRSKGVVIESHRSYSCQFDVSFDASRLEEITALPYIQFIGAQPEEPVLEGHDYRNSTGRSNYLNTSYNALNYNGSGVVIGVGEGGTGDNLIDVKGRLTEMETGTPSSHKITVMKNAGGGGNLDPADRNNAWGADMLSVVTFPDYSSLYSSHNLRYTNHSYGFSISGGYDLDARNHDLRIASYPNHLVIYSAGNSGDQTGYAPYNFSDWANITGQVKQNKNMFSIGNLAANDELIYHSSRGPMYDGRIIPQLALAGFEGTSYSAPKVTGQMAMLAQLYKDKNSGNEPSSSLLRTIIMNTADDLGNPGPDFKHGYGRPNMRRAYHIINNAQFLASSVSHGNTNTHNITVPANTKQVRVMIVWPDVAAAVNADPAIVNNLNLQATDPSSNTYNPWVLEHTANAYNLDLPATRGVDNINTIEQVTVDDPVAGAWNISVNGANVPIGPQTYYLTYEFLMDELHMAFPLENHKFIPGETYHLRWDSYGDTGTFSLDYRMAGVSWNNIVAGYDANSRVYTWTAPLVADIETIEFRVQRGSLTSASGVNYIGGVPENLRVFKVCNDEVTLKWSAVTGATSYKIYRLGAQYMEEVTANITIAGTSAILTGQSTTGSEYYAVSPLTGTFEGQRTNAIEKAPCDYGCVAISWTGTNSTDWFDGVNWTSEVPTCADNIIIPASAINQPAINAAGAECNTITIENGATLTMSSATAYTLSVCGDWINNGTFTRGIGIVDFVGTNSYQEIAGSSTTAFNILKVSKGVKERVLEATSLITLHGSTNPLNLVSGTFKLSSASTIAPFTSPKTIDGLMGLWNNGGTINSGNLSWSLNGTGLLRISGGTTNVGTNAGNGITYLNNPTIIIEGGALNVAGRISPNSGTSAAIYTQHGGTVTVNTVGSTSSTRAPFEINSVVPFTMTGGAIVIQRASSNAADYLNSSTSASVTGGALQIGNALTPASQAIRINSTVPIYNLLLNVHNSPTAQLINNNLTVSNDVTLSGGTLDLNSLNLNVGGDWINNGLSNPVASTVVFNGNQPQELAGTTATTFNNFTINNATGLTLSGNTNTTVDGVLTLTAGILNTGSNTLVVSNTATGAVSGGSATAYVNGILTRALPGSAASGNYFFPVGKNNNYYPFSLSAISTGTGSPAVTVEAFNSNSGGIAGIGLSALSTTEYWQATFSGMYSDGSVTLGRETSLGNLDVIARSNTLNGIYENLNGTVNNHVIENSDPTGSNLGFFVMAVKSGGCNDFEFVENESVCDGETFTWRGNDYTVAGTYYDSLVTVNPPGCDSVYVLNLTVKPSYLIVNDTIIWDYQFPFAWEDGIYWSAGTYNIIHTAVNGCDSILQLNLTSNSSDSIWVNKLMGTAVQANWSEISGAMKYEVRLSDLGGGGVYHPVAQTTLLQRKVKGLTPNTDYLLEIRHHDGVNWSPWNSFTPLVFNSGEVDFWFTKDIGTKAMLHWSELADVSGYILQYRTSGGNWQLRNILSETEIDMGVSQGLLENTEFEFRLIPRYENVSFWHSEPKGLTTNLISFSIIFSGGETADFTWDIVTNPFSSGYILQIRETGSASWSNYTSQTNQRFVNNLTSGLSYEFRLVVRYDGVSWGATSVRPLVGGSTKEVINAAHNIINVYPNPVTDILNMEIVTDEGSIYLWKIFDITGKQVATGQQILLEGFHLLQIDMSHQSSGIYFFVSNVSGGKKIIINKLN